MVVPGGASNSRKGVIPTEDTVRETSVVKRDYLRISREYQSGKDGWTIQRTIKRWYRKSC